MSYPVLPFILAPEHGSEEIAGEALAAGASGYVPREDQPPTVVSRLQESLNRDSTQRTNEGEGQQRYRHLIENSPAGINLFNESGQSIWCNRAVVDLLGLDTRQDLIGESIFDVIHPDDHDRAREELKRVIEEKEPVGPTQMKLHRPNGGVRYIRVSTAVGRFLGSDIGQAIAIDMTDREERDRQLQILDRWLRHNIRNEMTAIRGFAENIERGDVADVEATADRILDHAERLIEQADHEQTLTQIIAPTSPTSPTPVDITGIVEDRVTAHQHAHPEADISLDRAHGFEAVALPDIKTAIDELLTNAIEHHDSDRPAVQVSVANPENDDAGSVRIADDGPGIPESERTSLVLDEEIDDLHHGSGLGLALAYWVVRLSDGQITFDENDPRGSIITITLPTASPVAEQV